MEAEFLSITDDLKKIAVAQKDTLKNLEEQIKEIESTDVIKENNELKEQLTVYKTLHEDDTKTISELSIENKNLKNELYNQLYNEKIAMLSITSNKLEAYYKSNVEGERNRLSQFETSAKKRIDDMVKTLTANNVDIKDEIYASLRDLRGLLEEKVTAARTDLAKRSEEFDTQRNHELEALRSEKLTEEEIKIRSKQNNIEAFVGLNLLNKLGILLLIIGVISVSRFTYISMTDTLKSIFIFALGLVFVGAGEFLNRKKQNVFSLGITSGGLAILYSALALSYFGLETLSMYPALLICVAITVGAFVLAIRYNSQTIVAFALIGGYIPIFSIAGSEILIYSAMAYFVILNFFAFLISTNRKWVASEFTGFILNIIGTIYITSIVFSNRIDDMPFQGKDLISIAYILFTFLVYTLIPITSTYAKKLRFLKYDIIILAANTFISSILTYMAFYKVNLSDYVGLLAVIFAATYLLLGRFIETKLPDEVQTKKMFYLTGLTFIILIVPFQFKKVWLSLGWLIESVGLVSYGALVKDKRFQKSGFIIFSLCILAFLVVDLFSLYSPMFAYKYFAVTLGSLIILASYIYKDSLAGARLLQFKYFTLINLWVYIMYIISKTLSEFLDGSFPNSAFDAGYLVHAAMITVSLLMGYAFMRVKCIADKTTRYISMYIYLISCLFSFLINFGSPISSKMSDAPAIISILATVILIFVSLVSVLAVRDLVLFFVAEQKMGVEGYPILVSLFFVVILTQSLITQYGLEFNNAVISVIYILMALAWIIYGFVRRYSFIRRFGLGLSIMSVAKLFIIDLAFLSQGYRIVSYFLFGFTLLAISYVYQYFSKRLEVKTTVISE